MGSLYHLGLAFGASHRCMTNLVILEIRFPGNLNECELADVYHYKHCFFISRQHDAVPKTKIIQTRPSCATTGIK